MAVDFNPSVSFTSYKISDEAAKKARDKATAENNTQVLELLDQCSFEADNNAQEEKKAGKFKRGIASIAKFFTATEEITKGTAKGAVYGIMTGAACLAAGWLFGALPKGFKKGGSLKEVFKNPMKSMGAPAKVIAGLATAGVVAYHIIRGKMQANQRNAFVDQKLNIK